MASSDEPATCEDPDTPCCMKWGTCERISHASCYDAAGAVLYGPDESVTITRRNIGESFDSEALDSVIKAGAEELPWPEWAAHAVGLQLSC